VFDPLLDALRASRADFTEIRFERATLSSVVMRGRRLEAASTVADAGGIVRCLDRRHGWGVASFSRLSQLPTRVALAGELSRATEPVVAPELAAVPVREGRDVPGLPDDPRGVALDDKRRLLEQLNAELFGFDRRIVDTRASYHDVVVERWYVNSEGTRIESLHPDVALAALAVARDGGTVERAVASVGARGGWRRAQGHEELFRGASRRAVSLLGAQPARSGTYPVVLDPAFAGVLVHEAVGHLCEADMADDPGVRAAAPGTQLGSERLTVGDDGAAAGVRGSAAFDDEGTPTGNTVLLQNGVVVARLHSRETAARFAERPTGSARAASWRHPPVVRLRNPYVASGSGSRDDLLRDIRLGLYVCDAIGSQHEGDAYAFTAGHAYMIRDGQLAELVKHVVVAGRVTSLLGAVDRVAADFRWNEAGGGCTKWGQGPIPVAEGAPHVRLERADVRGVAP
jgi:TldD protein